jgi:ABC-2 type transport system permease protein
MRRIVLRRIALVLWKDWLEIRQQLGLVLSLFFLPLLFTVIPTVAIFAAGFAPPGELDDLRDLIDIALRNPSLEGLSNQELAQVVIGQPLSVLMLMTPILVPSIIASYSIVGEKVSQTLEPVLATPITTVELLLSKILSSLVPAVVITWFFGLIFMLALMFVSLSHRVFVALVSPTWFMLLLLCGPLLALTAVAATVAISSRVNDPRTAQQISAVVVLPLVLLVAGQLSGLLILSPIVVLFAAFALALIAAVVTYIATRLFQRETILTRWT